MARGPKPGGIDANQNVYHARAATITPGPYQEGKQIQLEVDHSYYPDLLPSRRVTATICEVISMTMSPVLDVTIPTRPGPPAHYVLKLFDRRFGTDLRSLYGSNLVPCTEENEAAFKAFVEKPGTMAAFLDRLKHANESEDGIPPRPHHFLDETPEGHGKFEAAVWRNCNEHFRCETKAYEQLSKFQGKALPRMLAHVRLAVMDDKLSSTSIGIPPRVAPYFEVRGILLERIEGYNLEDIATSPLAPPPGDGLTKWRQIIQSAVNLAHEINREGVIMEDCAPRNVVVDRRSQTPRFVDLAQCCFRDELVEAWQKWGWHEDNDDWDPGVEYWEYAGSTDNTGAIGAVMVNRVQRATGVKLEFEYPDREAIISGRTVEEEGKIPLAGSR